MEWFKSKGGQIIALATIVSTLAGFGYAGAGYVNRLENLEKKIGGIGETEDAQQAIEERFAGIETSVEYLEKQVDGIKIPDVSSLKAQLEGLSVAVRKSEENIVKVEKKIEGNKNPLAN
jgi:peptidoglycan hydrolase CwlO-like protein|tara:strand:+ start:1454 stop:1810 length:357 start_codon:yes stop_codon:yes gene_type:complete